MYINGLTRRSQRKPSGRDRKPSSAGFLHCKAILRGSLVERYKRCGKPGCKCANGPGHGPKYYLTVSYPKRRPEMDYVPAAFQEKVKEYLENYRKAKEILEELSEINRELLRRRERL